MLKIRINSMIYEPCITNDKALQYVRTAMFSREKKTIKYLDNYNVCLSILYSWRFFFFILYLKYYM